MPRPFPSSLRARLLLLVLLAVVPALALVLHTGIQELKREGQRAQESALHVVRLVSREHALAVDTTRHLVLTLTQVPVIRNLDAAGCRAFVARLREQHPRYANLAAATLDGKPFCSAVPPSRPVNFADRDWFRDVLRSGTAVVGGFIVGRITGKSSIVVAAPVPGTAGAPRAVVWASLDLDWLGEIAREAKLVPGATLTVIDRDGIILERLPERGSWVGRAASDSPIVRQVLAQAREGVTESRGVDGVERLYAYAPLRLPDGGLSGYVFSGTPVATVYAEARRALWRNLGWLGVLALAALAAAWWGGELFVARFVDRLIAVSERLARGDFAARLDTGEAPREVVRLARAFDYMGAALQAREADIRAGAQRLTDTLEGMTDGFVALDRDWCFTYVNHRAGELLGRRPADLIGRGMWSEFPEGVGQPVYDVYQRVMRERRPEQFENHDPARDRWFESRVHPIPEGIAVFFHDITERRRAEQELRNSEAKFRALADSTSAGIFIYQGERLVYVNRTAEALSGYSMTELLGRDFLDIVHPDDRELVRARARARLAGEQTPPRYELRIRTRNGEERWLDLTIGVITFQGQPAGVGTAFDITERKRAEERVGQQLAMLRALYDAAGRLSQSLDLPSLGALITQTCVENFGAALAWAGRAEPDGSVRALAHAPAGTSYMQDLTVRWDDTPEGHGPTGLAIRSGQPVVVTDLASDTRVAPWRQAALAAGICASAAFPLVGRVGPVGVVNIYSGQPGFFTPERLEFFEAYVRAAAAAIENAALFDAVRHQSAELETRVAERTAELESANAALTSFTYMVSHDLRAPLRAMQGFAQALLEDYGARLDDTGRDYAQRVVTAATRMETLIQELLHYNRLDRAHLDLAAVSLAGVVREALAQLEPECRAREARIEVQGTLPAVRAHAETLVQVVTNLVANALKFTAPGVRPAVQLSAERRATRVRLWVADNGLGIAPEHCRRIFQPFERLHGVEAFPGTGMGLAIVHKAVERMGGSCGVDSELGRGSRFWIELPAAGDQAHEP